MTQLFAGLGLAGHGAPLQPAAERVHPVAQSRKRELLVHLVSGGDWRKVLVFTRTRHGANRLAHQLCRSGIRAAAIHGDKNPPQRARAFADFKAGGVRVLVATDVAARGLDIEDLPQVVNFDLPQVAEDYAHRTGRAGSGGEAISLMAPEEQPLLAAIEKLLGRCIERVAIAGFEGDVPPPDRQEPKAEQTAKPVPGGQPPGAARRRRRRKPHADAPAQRHDAEDGRHEERQPLSNASQLFPSSASVFGEPRPQAASGRRRGGPDRSKAPRAAFTGNGRRRPV